MCEAELRLISHEIMKKSDKSILVRISWHFDQRIQSYNLQWM